MLPLKIKKDRFIYVHKALDIIHPLEFGLRIGKSLCSITMPFDPKAQYDLSATLFSIYSACLI
jgi:hypothetical protein